MFTFILIIHILACAFLIGIILIQQGRGGGLVDSFSGVESMFGTKTSTFLTRATAILATTFIITCLLLALMSNQRSKSVLERIKIKTPINQQTQPAIPTTPATKVPATATTTTSPVVTPSAAEQKTPSAPAPVETPKPVVEQAPVSVPAGQNQTATP